VELLPCLLCLENKPVTAGLLCPAHGKPRPPNLPNNTNVPSSPHFVCGGACVLDAVIHAMQVTDERGEIIEGMAPPHPRGGVRCIGRVRDEFNVEKRCSECLDDIQIRERVEAALRKPELAKDALVALRALSEGRRLVGCCWCCCLSSFSKWKAVVELLDGTAWVSSGFGAVACTSSCGPGARDPPAVRRHRSLHPPAFSRGGPPARHRQHYDPQVSSVLHGLSGFSRVHGPHVRPGRLRGAFLRALF
jgi:hypothetical protein